MQFPHQKPFWLRPSAVASSPKQSVDQLKRELKEWEHQFQKEHGRKPTKEDLDRLPDIKQKYNLHLRLAKTSGTPEPERKEGADVARKRKRESNGDDQHHHDNKVGADERNEESWSHLESLPAK